MGVLKSWEARYYADDGEEWDGGTSIAGEKRRSKKKKKKKKTRHRTTAPCEKTRPKLPKGRSEEWVAETSLGVKFASATRPTAQEGGGSLQNTSGGGRLALFTFSISIKRRGQSKAASTTLRPTKREASSKPKKK